MRSLETPLDAMHAALGIWHKVVKLNLKIANLANQAALNEKLQQLVLAAFDVHLHQINFNDLLLVQQFSNADELYGNVVRGSFEY